MRILIIIPFLFLGFKLIGQELNFRISGKIIAENNEKISAQILIYADNKLQTKLNIKKDGDYDFTIPIGPEYKLTFKSKKRVSKHLLISSKKIHSEGITNGELPLHFQITLFRKCKESNYKFLKKEAVGEFYFDANSGYMEFDRKKALSIINRIKQEEEKCKH